MSLISMTTIATLIPVLRVILKRPPSPLVAVVPATETNLTLTRTLILTLTLRITVNPNPA